MSVFYLRYRDIKTACAKAVGMAPNDSRVLDYVNRAIEMLLYEGKWKGTTPRFNFCLQSGCIVWPRELETPEAIAVCSVPFKIRSGWYEFAENGPGIISEDSNLCKTIIDRGEVCAFDEVVGENKKLAVYAERNEGTGKYINLQFYNQYGQWVTSTFNGSLVEGEKLTIPSTGGSYAYTTNICKPGGLWRVQKDITLGLIRLFSYDTTTGDLKPLAIYQADEEIPTYRRSLIPSLSGSCDQTPVTVVAKLRFIPVSVDDSWVIIPHREAIRLACQAIKKWEDDLDTEANLKWAEAIRLLGKQMAHHTGAGLRASIQFESPTTFGGGIVVQQ